MLSIIWSKKTRAILAFLREMNDSLNKQYPNHKYYTKEQISWVVVIQFPKYIRFIEYALFIYMHIDDFTKMNSLLGDIYSGDEINRNILHVLNEVKDKSALAKFSSVSSANSMRL